MTTHELLQALKFNEHSAKQLAFMVADYKTLAYRHALMCCIDPSDDIKVDSTLKALAKDPTVSERIIERLKTE